MSVSVYEKRKGRETNEREKEERYGEKNEKERQVERYSWIKQGGFFLHGVFQRRGAVVTK